MPRRWKRSIILAALPTVFALLCAGCTDAPAAPVGPLALNGPALPLAAKRELAQAVNGRQSRGEQDEMLRIESRVPGFGGFFIDSAGEVTAYMKRGRTTPVSEVRAVLVSTYAGRSAAVREVTASIGRARVAEADFSLSELVAYQRLVENRIGRLRGLHGVGVSIPENRLIAFFDNATDTTYAGSGFAALGVPPNAYVAKVRPRMAQSSVSFFDRVRPTHGGVMITFAPTPSGDPVGCSLGFNVKLINSALGVIYMLTAAHCANEAMGINGFTGYLNVYQPTIAGGQVGTIASNPPWDVNCPGYDWCIPADGMLVSYVNAGGERTIGTSVTEGKHGQLGSGTINNWYPISGVVAPELIRLGLNKVHKSGWASGTTTGHITATCATQEATGAYWSDVAMDTVTRHVLYQCVTIVEDIGAGFGDSGGAVFARQVDGGPYYALGIQAVATVTPGSSYCQYGSLCQIAFSTIGSLQLHLGVNLYPQTSDN